MNPYRQRVVTFLGFDSVGDWRLKLYTLRSADTPEVRPDFYAAAKPTLTEHLEALRPPMLIAGTDWNHLETYKVGFAIIHIGAEAVFLLCDYWVGENMLNHSAWVSSFDGKPEWHSINASGTRVCVWELAIQAHERQSWIKHVYNLEAEPRFEDYLSDGFNAIL
jgi:hypothetical protein